MGYNMTGCQCPDCGGSAEYDCETGAVYCQSCIRRRNSHEREKKTMKSLRDLRGVSVYLTSLFDMNIKNIFELALFADCTKCRIAVTIASRSKKRKDLVERVVNTTLSTLPTATVPSENSSAKKKMEALSSKVLLQIGHMLTPHDQVRVVMYDAHVTAAELKVAMEAEAISSGENNPVYVTNPDGNPIFILYRIMSDEVARSRSAAA